MNDDNNITICSKIIINDQNKIEHGQVYFQLSFGLQVNDAIVYARGLLQQNTLPLITRTFRLIGTINFPVGTIGILPKTILRPS